MFKKYYTHKRNIHLSDKRVCFQHKIHNNFYQDETMEKAFKQMKLPVKEIFKNYYIIRFETYRKKPLPININDMGRCLQDSINPVIHYTTYRSNT